MNGQGVLCHQLLRDLSCKGQFEAALHINLCKLFLFRVDVIA